MKCRLTDSSFLKAKVGLRLNHLPEKDEVRVLDAYAGEGTIWKKVKAKTQKKLTVVGIEKKKRRGIYLRGDNRRWLDVIEPDQYDIIDLDAYGVPFEQLEILLKSKTKAKIFFTFNLVNEGRLPNKMLNLCGYSNEMIKKCPTLFCKKPWEKWKLYLATRGIKRIRYVVKKKKNVPYYYGVFELKT